MSSSAIDTDSLNLEENITEEKTEDRSQELKVFETPTPLQLAIILKKTKLPFNEKHSAPFNTGAAVLTSSQTAFMLGSVSIDAAYSAMFGQGQNTVNYGKTIVKLFSDLKINSPQTDALLKRFDKNITQTDSMAIIIGEAYTMAYRHFKDNKQEELGLQIVAGSFFEGLHLTTLQDKVLNYNELKEFIDSQKKYAENIFNLLSFYSKKEETTKIISHLMKIQDLFNTYPHLADSSKKNYDKQLQLIKALQEQSFQARKDLLGN
ncbi:MAG: hypothetical protein IT239_03555 [Bacteroidia bacterium]|nr:hypothetical protein [Bacteroidia bacterium]